MMPLSFYWDLLKDKYVRWKYEKQSKTTSKGSVILMFHHVADTCPEGVSESCYSTITDFELLLTHIIPSKQIVSISELCEQLNSGIVPSNKVVITFDDVPSDVYYNAIPFLRRYSAPYTLYISIDLIDKDGYLSKEQIIELSKDPLCTIGSHTVSHCMLKKKNNIDLHKEVAESKKLLEQMINHRVEHFAYPYGTPFAINRKTINYLMESGLYRSAVCTIPAFINQYSITNMYSLPRIHSQLFTSRFNNI